MIKSGKERTFPLTKELGTHSIFRKEQNQKKAKNHSAIQISVHFNFNSRKFPNVEVSMSTNPQTLMNEPGSVCVSHSFPTGPDRNAAVQC